MRYDYVIVGAGSAGSVLAARLSEDSNRSVLLIEAGPDYGDIQNLPDSVRLGNNTWLSAYGTDAHAWGYMATATDDRPPFPLPRGKVMGGSSAINGQVFFRGVPEDYDEWAEQGNDEWSYVKVLPSFRKSETDLDFPGGDFHGSDGPTPVRRYKKEEMLPVASAFWDACLAAGFPETPDMNHPDSTGVGARPMNNIDGVRMSAALTYLDAVRHRLNLTIRGDVLVRQVLFDGRRAIGVEAQSGGEVFVVDADQVILSGGAINSPQMLMLSGVGPADHLVGQGVDVVHDLPGVGENLRDHPNVILLFRTSTEPPETFAPGIQAGMRYTTPDSLVRSDMSMSPILMTADHPAAQGVPDSESCAGISLGIQKPATAGRLQLDSRDPHVQPSLDYRYLSDAGDRERMRGAVRLAVELSERPELEGLLVERLAPTNEDLESDESLDRWMLATVSTQHHSSGTCKMGPASDPMAVVDQYGRVHGMEGLRVVDASIMPDVVRANTNATTMMIAERVAEFITAGR